MINTRTFTDLDFGFNINPIKKNLIISSDEQAIMRAMRNILMTNHYEIPFNSKIGSSIRNLLFNPIENSSSKILEREISDTIKNFEPRVNLQAVVVTPNIQNHYYNITIYFNIINSTTQLTLNFTLNRLR